MTIESDGGSYAAVRRENHPLCMVCSEANGRGLALTFEIIAEGVVEGSFACEAAFAGYSSVLHGGMICTLLDGAMTNCLFACGLAAVTADLNVRFRHPVVVGVPVKVRAWIESGRWPLYELAAEVIQAGQVKASGRGRFIDRRIAGRVGVGKGWPAG